MVIRNAVTNTNLLSIRCHGNSDFLNDGAFDGATETFHGDVSRLVPAVFINYQKIVGSVCTEMTAAEKLAVDSSVIQFASLLQGFNEPEEISSDGTLSVNTYMSIISGNTEVSLPDGDLRGRHKRITTQGGANLTVNCTLNGPFSGFTLGANNKAQLVWTGAYWALIDWKGLTKILV